LNKDNHKIEEANVEETVAMNSQQARNLINNIFDLELKRETLLKMKQNYQTKVKE
jgi:hypothetical protein